MFTAYCLLSVGSFVSADSGQYGQYGGGSPSYSIMIDKMVTTGNQTKGGQPSDSEGKDVYVDNLSPSDPRFAPNDKVKFQIKIKNTSNVTLENVTVKDILPEWVYAIEGPGDYDKDTHTISWTYPKLDSGQEKIETVIAKVKPQDQLPADKGLICILNKSTVSATNAHDEDTAQFCIEKQVTTKGGQPVTTTPQAGAPLLAFGALNLLGLGVGVWMRKRN